MNVKNNGKATMEKDIVTTIKDEAVTTEQPQILEEIAVEELSIDGVCGVY
jgi:mycofactocin precursor